MSSSIETKIANLEKELNELKEKFIEEKFMNEVEKFIKEVVRKKINNEHPRDFVYVYLYVQDDEPIDEWVGEQPDYEGRLYMYQIYEDEKIDKYTDHKLEKLGLLRLFKEFDVYITFGHCENIFAIKYKQLPSQ